MNEQQIRALIQQEIQSNSSMSRFALTTTNKHQHTGLDSPQVNQNNIKPGIRVEGSITFSQATTYRIATNFNPTAVWVHGNVTGALGEKFITTGNAQLGGQSFYLQPGTAPLATTSVVVGGPPQKIIQSCSYFGGTSGSGGVLHTLVDEGHIVDIFYSSVHARATITAFDSRSITFTVDNLDAGWNINLSFTIT